MIDSKKLKNTGLFLLLVIADIAIIQLFRIITPRIALLRLSFYFLVIAASLFVYYSLTKPKNIIRTGLLLSLLCFLIALFESFVVHVIIGKGQYSLFYLIPSSFALVLPFIIAIIYKAQLKKKNSGKLKNSLKIGKDFSDWDKTKQPYATFVVKGCFILW